MKNLARGLVGEKSSLKCWLSSLKKEFPVKNTDVVIVVDYDDLPTVIDIRIG